MRTFLGFLLILSFSIGLAASKSKSKKFYVIRVKEGGAELYKASKSQDVVTEMRAGEELQLIKKGPTRSYVKTSGGVKGYVTNKRLEKIEVGAQTEHSIGEQEVLGWLDNPSAVYILDNTGPDFSALPLEREFQEEIVEYRDRETVEMSNDEN